MSSDEKSGIDTSIEIEIVKQSAVPLQVVVGENDNIEYGNPEVATTHVQGGHADPQLPRSKGSRHNFIELATEDSVTDSDLRKISLEMDRIKTAKAEGRLFDCVVLCCIVLYSLSI